MTTQPTVPPSDLVPISLIAPELGEQLETLAERLAPNVVTDDIGLRCVAADVARRLISEHRARQAAVAERMAAAFEALVVAESQRRRPLGIPVPLGASSDVTALEVMKSEARYEGVTPS
jgi:hypothetical protein